MSAPNEARAAVFLDRDGILNEAIVIDGKPYPPRLISDVRIPSDVLTGCLTLRRLGYSLIVVTNQPDIARGTVTEESVQAIHAHLGSLLPIDEFGLCPHDDSDGCSCRKPAPGLILTAAGRHGIELSRSWMVGDRWRDIEAGKAAGCRTILVRNTLYREAQAEGADAEVATFSEVVKVIAASREHVETHT